MFMLYVTIDLWINHIFYGYKFSKIKINKYYEIFYLN